jgi:hypothetical protein
VLIFLAKLLLFQLFESYLSLPDAQEHLTYIPSPSLCTAKTGYTVKKGYQFSRPQSGCHLPNSPWGGIIKLFPARESLVRNIPAGEKSLTFFTV